MYNSKNLSKPLGATYCYLSRRYISWDKLSNKKITRLQSEIELEDPEFKSRLVNRNPRNLEQSFLEQKPSGFWFEKSPATDWNVIGLEQSGDYLTAYLRHWSGRTIIYASTKETQLKKYCVNPGSTQAATLLGKVLSRRCLQSGYLYAGVDPKISQDAPKISVFLESISKEGFVLEEPQQIEPRSNTDI